MNWATLSSLIVLVCGIAFSLLALLGHGEFWYRIMFSIIMILSSVMAFHGNFLLQNKILFKKEPTITYLLFYLFSPILSITSLGLIFSLLLTIS